MSVHLRSRKVFYIYCVNVRRQLLRVRRLAARERGANFPQQLPKRYVQLLSQSVSQPVAHSWLLLDDGLGRKTVSLILLTARRAAKPGTLARSTRFTRFAFCWRLMIEKTDWQRRHHARITIIHLCVFQFLKVELQWKVIIQIACFSRLPCSNLILEKWSIF